MSTPIVRALPLACALLASSAMVTGHAQTPFGFVGLSEDPNAPFLAATALNAAGATKQDVGGSVSGQTISKPNGTASLPLTDLLDFYIENYALASDAAGDDGPRIQRAVNDAVAAGGGRVRLPAGIVPWNSQVVVQGAVVQIEGHGWAEDVASGTRVEISSTLSSPLLVQGAAARGGGIRGMSFQQVQPAPAPGWSPTVYPFVIDIENTFGEWSVDEIFLYNCYDGVRSIGSGRTFIGKIRGQPLHCGLYIDAAYDKTDFGNVRFWPYWTSDANVINWQQANADAIRLFRVDGLHAPSVFALGYRSGMRMSLSPILNPVTSASIGKTTLAQIGAFYPDSCLYNLYVDGDGSSAHFASTYTGSESLSAVPLPGSIPIYVAAANTTLSLDSTRLFFGETNVIVFDNAAGGNVLMIGNADLNTFNQKLPNDATAIRSVNATVPNTIMIANATMANANGASLINDCNAFCRCPGDTPFQVTPASGATVTLPASHGMALIEPAGPLSSLTVMLPSIYPPNWRLAIVSTQNIAAVGWTTAGGIPIIAAPAALVAGQRREFLFFSASITAEGANAWYAL